MVTYNPFPSCSTETLKINEKEKRRKRGAIELSDLNLRYDHWHSAVSTIIIIVSIKTSARKSSRQNICFFDRISEVSFPKAKSSGQLEVNASPAYFHGQQFLRLLIYRVKESLVSLAQAWFKWLGPWFNNRTLLFPKKISLAIYDK